ncbi:MAG TPA: Wzz/FepE/Etk N-terminal domain-containing protein [Candidatus Acidoferrales bacterium]|nr:Wzz/FepE/Etk N-terminal domain-containing protein [Candidatus Acidoferrales bacterium]
MGQRPPNSRLLPEQYIADPDYLEQIERRAAREKNIARIKLLWKHKATILRFAIWGLALFLALAYIVPQRYTATTRLMPPDQPNAGMAILGAISGKGAPGAVGALADEFLGIKNSGDLFVGILGSQSVQDDLITKFNLRKVYHDRKWENARHDLAKKSDISADRKSGIITIEVTDHNAKRAAAMAAEYVSALNNVVTHVKTSSAHRERVFLEQRLAQVSTDLESAERAFGDFASKNTALDIKEQGRAMISAGAELQGELIAAQTELQGLRQIYTDNNVRVRATEARITELQHELTKMGGVPGGTKGHANEPNASQQNGQLYPPLRQLPLLGVTWADLYRRAVVQEKVFETLTQEYELAKVEEVKETPSVKILDSAQIPQKGFPPRFWFVFVGAILAVIAGGLFVVGRDRWEQVDPDDPGKVFAVEIMQGMKSLTAGSGGDQQGLKARVRNHFRHRADSGNESHNGDHPSTS